MSFHALFSILPNAQRSFFPLFPHPQISLLFSVSLFTFLELMQKWLLWQCSVALIRLWWIEDAKVGHPIWLWRRLQSFFVEADFSLSPFGPLNSARTPSKVNKFGSLKGLLSPLRGCTACTISLVAWNESSFAVTLDNCGSWRILLHLCFPLPHHFLIFNEWLLHHPCKSAF